MGLTSQTRRLTASTPWSMAVSPRPTLISVEALAQPTRLRRRQRYPRRRRPPAAADAAERAPVRRPCRLHGRLSVQQLRGRRVPLGPAAVVPVVGGAGGAVGAAATEPLAGVIGIGAGRMAASEGRGVAAV